jgi:hypothetical protein
VRILYYEVDYSFACIHVFVEWVRSGRDDHNNDVQVHDYYNDDYYDHDYFDDYFDDKHYDYNVNHHHDPCWHSC